MATIEKLMDAKPIIPHPYRLNPSCLSCGKEATHTVLLDNGEVVISRKLCKDCLNTL